MSYLWRAARLKLGLAPSPLLATFAGVTFAVDTEHYQLRSRLKQQAVQPVLARLLGLCDSKTLFVDIGANVGIFSLLVASRAGAHALAIEPVRSTFHALVRNCSLNSALAITPLNLAMGTAPALVEITAVPKSGVNRIAIMTSRQGEPRQKTFQLEMDQLQLHELARSFRRVVIKIDVERYEFEVLAGAQQLLGLDMPIAVCVEAEPEQHGRVHALLGSRFHACNPKALARQNILVSDENDLNDVFFVNDAWGRVA
ncbi:MAG: FkbM family methyltransferase [Synechococcus sp.]|nr:FkbM family methyltransferase [Synechococcus sp.]